MYVCRNRNISYDNILKIWFLQYWIYYYILHLQIFFQQTFSKFFFTGNCGMDASTLPLSIIIIGVGNANFDTVDELDMDTVRLTAPDGRMAARDSVQFVPFLTNWTVSQTAIRPSRAVKRTMSTSNSSMVSKSALPTPTMIIDNGSIEASTIAS